MPTNRADGWSTPEEQPGDGREIFSNTERMWINATGWPALLKNDEAAQYLGISVDTLRKLTNDREVRKVTVPGTTASRYSRIELDAAIARWGRRK